MASEVEDLRSGMEGLYQIVHHVFRRTTASATSGQKIIVVYSLYFWKVK